EAPPTKAKCLVGRSCPVVLQLIGKGDVKKSAFQLDDTKQLRLVAYNFDEKSERGKLDIEGAACDTSLIDMESGARVERMLKVNELGNVTVRLNLGSAGHAIVSAKVIKDQP